MSLRFRLNILIIALFALVLLLGSIFVIVNARQAISQELESSANLALQLLTAATMTSMTEQQHKWRLSLMQNLNTLTKVRHLNISIIGGDERPIMPVIRNATQLESVAPSWFVRLVAPAPSEFRRRLSTPHVPYTEIVIRPNPADEIAEAWNETRVLLGLLFSLVLLINVLVFLTTGRSFKPINQILDALKVIEQGNYRARLPQFSLPELDQISRSFNHMAHFLELARQEKRLLTKRSLAIQEDERRHLAQELHDELGQSISAIKALSVSIGQHRDVTNTVVAEGARSIASICDHVYDVVRGMMNRLRPIILDEFGLQTILERMVDDWNTYHEDTFCRLTVEGDLQHLSNEYKINLYRIVQECLNNIAKHANASEAEIRLQYPEQSNHLAANHLRLTVKDNGRGFDVQQRPRGLGLLGMRERVEALNGALQIDATAGAGVRIDFSIPVEITGAATKG